MKAAIERNPRPDAPDLEKWLQVAAGALHLSGWRFDMATGNMYSHERASCSFVVIDRDLAERLFARLGKA